MSEGDIWPPEIHERIVMDPAILVGKPVVKGTRISVSMILGLVAHGISFDEIVEDYPSLTKDDIRLAILYAAYRLDRAEGGQEASTGRSSVLE